MALLEGERKQDTRTHMHTHEHMYTQTMDRTPQTMHTAKAFTRSPKATALYAHTHLQYYNLIGTGIPEASNRVPTFPYDVRGGRGTEALRL